MSFVIRGAQLEDISQLLELAKQAALLNLPADRRVLEQKIERSVASFSGELPKDQAEYLFLIEDLEGQVVVGSSLILAKHGTPSSPHSSFKVIKRDRFSKDLGIGFIHQVLRFHQSTDGPTEIGGLIVDRSYRRRPEKLGRQISLVRFLYMAIHPERFEKRVLCELTPPLTDEGRSEFWEALGRRFTGLNYQEADLISQQNKEFIQSLFPEEDIYLTLLNSKARLVLGRVGVETRPAQHLLEKIGFRYLDEVDPFDGGPHYGAELATISIVSQAKKLTVSSAESQLYSQRGLVGFEREGQFFAQQTAFEISGAEISLPAATLASLAAERGQEVFVSAV